MSLQSLKKSYAGLLTEGQSESTFACRKINGGSHPGATVHIHVLLCACVYVMGKF